VVINLLDIKNVVAFIYFIPYFLQSLYSIIGFK